MEKKLGEELDLLKEQLLEMAAKVESNIDAAISGLRARDLDALQSVIERDGEVDLAELQIDESCISLLALHQPVARDLRFIATALKIVKDIERVGDIAKNIARHGLKMIEARPIEFPESLSRMAVDSRDLLRRALDAFVNQDAEAARQVIREDDTVDEAHRRNVGTFVKQMAPNPSLVGPMTQLLAVNKFLERIGDHSTNIAAMVVYLVEGRDIRHYQKQRSALENQK